MDDPLQMEVLDSSCDVQNLGVCVSAMVGKIPNPETNQTKPFHFPVPCASLPIEIILDAAISLKLHDDVAEMWYC